MERFHFAGLILRFQRGHPKATRDSQRSPIERVGCPASIAAGVTKYERVEFGCGRFSPAPNRRRAGNRSPSERTTAMNTYPLKTGVLPENGTGIGTVTRAMVQDRARDAQRLAVKLP